MLPPRFRLPALARWLLFSLAAGLLFSLTNPRFVLGSHESVLVALAGTLIWTLQYFAVLALLARIIEQARRYLPLVEGPRRNLYAHALLSVAFSAIHPGLTVILIALENPFLPWGIRFRTDFVEGFPHFFHHELLFYWLILAVGEAVAYDRRVRGQRIAQHNLERQLARARLSALEMQLHPHFLFNTLNSIAELVYQSPAGADRALVRLSSLLERVHRPSGGQLVTLREEVEFLEQYLALEKLRFEENLDLHVDFPPPLLGLRVPSLILQPLVENAVRHGAARMGRRTVLSIRAHREDDRLVVAIENELPEPDGEHGGSRRGGGLGLVNTSARLRQIYGDEARLGVDDNPVQGRFAVRLELPVSFFAEVEPADAALTDPGPRYWTVERASG